MVNYLLVVQLFIFHENFFEDLIQPEREISYFLLCQFLPLPTYLITPMYVKIPFCYWWDKGKRVKLWQKNHLLMSCSLSVRKIPWRRAWELTLVFLPGEFCRQRSLVGYSSWGHKEPDMTKQLTMEAEFPLSQLFLPGRYIALNGDDFIITVRIVSVQE